ncbi:MAG: 30S ribosomal protein S20 [Lactobacillus sp.]|nr:30S ribosomal protein S20 [Lactobacillus sp.]
MANHKSAKTRIRRNNKRNIINSSRRSRVRTFIKKVIAAINENNKELAQASFKVAESELMRAARIGVVETNKASRIVSRLSKKIKAL